jgi:hypothetical protein
MRTSLTFPLDADFMIIPGLSPFECIFIDSTKEKMMEEPDMSIRVTVKTITKFQGFKESFPFGTKCRG